MEIVELLTAGAGGGLLGLVGNVVNRWMSMKEHKQLMELKRFEAEVEGRKDLHEINLLKMEMEHTARETEHAIELADVQGDWDIKKASYAIDDGGDRAGPLASFIRTTMRPFLTYLLLGTSGVFVAFGYGGEDVKQQYVLSLISLGSMCAAWWFGERGTMRIGAGGK